VTSHRALMSLLFNADKAVEVITAAEELGVLAALDHGSATLGDLAAGLGLRPMRLHKLLDCLECLGFVVRDDGLYRAVPGAHQAAIDVFGPDSQERDRDSYPWRRVRGRLAEVLRGDYAMPAEDFVWPLTDPEQIAGFERSMAVGLPPILEAFRRNASRLWPANRLLDVGGGDGSLAAELLGAVPGLTVDVYNLPAVQSLVDRTRTTGGWGSRLGFVAGDFFAEPLPGGYDVLSFVRVLHDWPEPEAQSLLVKAFEALPPGGRVLICEEFRTGDRLAAQFFWSYFLIGVDSCTSMLRSTAAYDRMLTAAGFKRVEVLPGPFEIVLATRA